MPDWNEDENQNELGDFNMCSLFILVRFDYELWVQTVQHIYAIRYKSFYMIFTIEIHKLRSELSLLLVSERKLMNEFTQGAYGSCMELYGYVITFLCHCTFNKHLKMEVTRDVQLTIKVEIVLTHWKLNGSGLLLYCPSVLDSLTQSWWFFAHIFI